MKNIIVLALSIALVGCNFMTIEPHSLDKSKIIYMERTTNPMGHAIRNFLTKKGYKLTSGFRRARVDHIFINKSAKDVDKTPTYFLGISARSSGVWPVWCVFNGFNHWDFDMHIIDNETGQEIFTWSGFGCQNSSLRKLDRALDELKIK